MQTNQIPTGSFAGAKRFCERETVRVTFLSQLLPCYPFIPIKNSGISFCDLGEEKKEGGQRPELFLFPVFNLSPYIITASSLGLHNVAVKSLNE